MKYTKKRAELIAESIKNLDSITDACELGGISTVSYYKWYNTIPEFRALMDDAFNTGLDLTKHQAIHAIKSQFTKNWTSAAWWLERKYPEEFGKQDKLDTNMTINQVQIHYIVPEEQKKIEDTQTIKIIENGKDNT